MQRVADYIADFIYRLGVEHAFMVSGGGMMFLSDGIAQHPHLQAICTHHEQSAAMAAAAYARYREGFGAVYVTTGCGGTNAVTGLLGAWQDSVSCIFISGQSKRIETVRNSGLSIRQIGVQEADIIEIVSSIAKYAVMVNDPADIAYHLEKAAYLARTGRPGPVWIDVPMDIQAAMIEPESLRHFDLDSESDALPHLTTEQLRPLAELLKQAERPIIVAGQGIRLAGAIPAFRQFIESHHIPFAVSRLGIDVLPSDHPLYIGRIGNKGDRAGNLAVQNSDLLLAIGSRLSVSSTGHEYEQFARHARHVVVDIDPIEHQKNTVRIDHFLWADAGDFLTKAMTLPQPRTEEWVARCQRWKSQYPVCLPEYAGTQGGINLYYFVERLSRKMKDDGVIITDTGSAYFVVSQGMQFRAEQRYITSGAQAVMGFSLPAAIGASIARGCGEVLAITGDGSFQMNLQELQTMLHHRLPIKLFVWNNDGYLSIRATQARFFEGRYIGTDNTSGVSFPSLQKIAQAYGIRYVLAADSAQLDAALDEVLRDSDPVLCEVRCLRDQEIVPTVASVRLPSGKMQSFPLEDMYPFLERDEFYANQMIPHFLVTPEEKKTSE